MQLQPNTDKLVKIRKRKNEHIKICMEKDIDLHNNGFEKFSLSHTALPELDFASISTECEFLGKTFSSPFLITGMSGGVKYGQILNETLGFVAEKYNIPLGVGSQKIMMRDSTTAKYFSLRKKYPRLFLIGNLGATELRHPSTLEHIKKMIDDLELNAFAFHLNPLQECIQPEGQRDFAGVLAGLEQAVKSLQVPVLVKEVGSGIGERDFINLTSIGIKAIDIAGSGGTSWSLVESYRATGLQKKIGVLFKDWGYSTADSLHKCVNLRKARNLKVDLVATGGMRDGIDAAKGLALGAQMIGIGLPLLHAVFGPSKAKNPQRNTAEVLEFYLNSLKIAMFCTGSKDISSLKSVITATPEKNHA